METCVVYVFAGVGHSLEYGVRENISRYLHIFEKMQFVIIYELCDIRVTQLNYT